MNTISKGVQRILDNVRKDGWANLLTSVGVKGRDKRLAADVYWEPIDQSTAERMYADDFVAAKVVDTLPDEMTREWIEFTDDDMEYREFCDRRFHELSVQVRFNIACKWGRMFGGAALFVVTEDGGKWNQSLFDGFRGVLALQVLTRYELNPASADSSLKSNNYGNPLTYRVQPTGSYSQAAAAPMDVPLFETEFYYDRFIRFEGAPLGRQLRAQQNSWGDSVLTRLKNPLRNYQQSHDAAVSALMDFSVGVFKITNLSELISTGREAAVLQRIEIANLSKSMLRALVIDANETYEHVTRNLTGIPELIKKTEERLNAAANMPHTLLFGDSPSGLGATGDSEEGAWYDFVAQQQQIQFKPGIDFLLKLLALEYGAEEPCAWRFKPLTQMSQKEQADVHKTMSEADGNYIDRGVLAPLDVTKSRFSGEYSLETAIDIKEYEANPPMPPAAINEGNTMPPNEADAPEPTDKETEIHQNG